MQPRFKFYVKQAADTAWTFLADEPEGWQDLQDEITRDYSIHGLLVETKCTLTFIGDGYDYIKNVFDCQSFCAEVQLKIEESCSEGEPYGAYFEGLIKMGDVKFNMNKCQLETPIIDNSYYARIKNNVGIEAFPHVGKSKNGIDIDVALLETCFMFTVSTGAYSPTARKAYKVYEILKFLVAFMSDDEVDFASGYFSTGEMAYLFLTNGAHLKDGNIANYGNADIGKLSFQNLVDELYKTCNIGFTIETGGVKPVLRIENADYFYGSTIVDTLNNANGVIKKIKTDQLYAYVNFGSDKTIDDVPALSFPDNIDFLGWKDEKFHLTGQCNTETTLDLKGEFVRSSNVIEDVLDGVTSSPNETYDEDFIFVIGEVDGANYRAIHYDIYGAGTAPYFYNGNITNDNIALRFFDAIPNSIATYLGTGTDATFVAITSSDSASHSSAYVEFPFVWDDDYTPPNYDVGNYYGNGTAQGSPVVSPNSIYTAPQVGLYRFEARLDIDVTAWTVTSPSTSNERFVLTMFRLDSFGAPIISWNETVYITATGLLSVIFNQSTILNAGDIIKWRLSAQAGAGNGFDFIIKEDSYFKCLTAFSSGGIYQEGDPENFKSINYTFEYPISNTRWNAIKAAPRQKLAFNIDSLNNIEPWIEKIVYNKKDAIANITLVGQQKTIC